MLGTRLTANIASGVLKHRKKGLDGAAIAETNPLRMKPEYINEATASIASDGTDLAKDLERHVTEKRKNKPTAMMPDYINEPTAGYRAKVKIAKTNPLDNSGEQTSKRPASIGFSDHFKYAS